MFELRDSKLGKVKIINITEARQNMASIMNDNDFNYVITKNNKPIRVIINYDEYKSNRDELEKINQPIVQSTPAPLPQPIIEDKPQIESAKKESPIIQNEIKVEEKVDRNFESFETPEKRDDPEQAYYEKFKKLYEQNDIFEDQQSIQDVAPSSSMPEPLQKMMEQNSQVEQRKVFQEEIQKEKIETKVEPIVHEDKGSEPPSIQDLLNELEHEKLSGENSGTSESGNYFDPNKNDF